MKRYSLYVLLLCILLGCTTGCNHQDPDVATTTDVSLIFPQSQEAVQSEESKPKQSKTVESTLSQTEKQTTSETISVIDKEQNIKFHLNEKVDYAYNYKGTHPNPPEVVVCRSLADFNQYHSAYQQYDHWIDTYTKEYFKSKSLLLFLARDLILSAEKVTLSGDTVFVEFTEPAMETDDLVEYYVFPLEIHHTLNDVENGEIIIQGIKEVTKKSFVVK